MNDLKDSEFKTVICYPRFSEEEFVKRIQELETLPVRFFRFEGNKKIGNIQILGKGHASLVVKTISAEGYVYALKIRRTDSGKPDMFHEVEMLIKANKLGVGAKLKGFTQNFIVLNFIEGPLLSDWISQHENRRNKLKKIILKILEQCYSLDTGHLDHGELNRAEKHVIIDNDDKPFIIDFEKSSDTRRVSNVTSISQYLFVKGGLASKVERALGTIDKQVLLEKLREYKQSPSDKNFKQILFTLNLP